MLVAGWPEALNADDDTQFVLDQVVVKLNLDNGATIADINAAYGTTTLDMLLGSAGIYLLQVGPGGDVEQLVDDMADDPRLIYAEPNFIGEMPEGGPSGTWGWGGYDPDPYLGQYAVAQLNLAQAHAVTMGDGVIVAVLDTGAQLNHPRLAGQVIAGYDFISDEAIPEDEPNGIDEDNDGLVDEGFGHGTHVSGIISLVAPSAQIMPLRVLDSDGRGNDYVLAEAIQFARLNGATVINMSLGTPTDSDLLEDVVAEATAAGVVIIAAAGNQDSSSEQFPAADPNALGVASVGPEKVRSSFSNFGPWVDIVAPGKSITSTFPIDGYAQWSGTSMATGFVTGQAALIRSAQPELNADSVSQLIRSTAIPIDDLNPSYAGYLGNGLIDIGASVTPGTAVDCGPALTLSPDADAWVEQNSPTNNKGDDSTLKVKSQGSNDNFRLLVRFSWPASLPEGCVIQEATLRLYAPSHSEGRTLQALRLAESWSESAVTWQNQPVAAGDAALISSGPGYVEWPVGPQVQEMIDAGAFHGFLIRDAAENGPGAEQQFNSREKGEYPPELVIHFQAGSAIDNIPPVTSILSAPPPSTSSIDATFAFAANEPGATFACSLDNAPFAGCESPQSFSALALGAHIFSVQATDAAGNTDATPALLSWTIAPPLPPITVSCGQVLVASGRVVNDLSECPADGLVIGASDITLDLDGRTIDGVGQGAGIRNDGFDSVTIQNGVVQQFGIGVLLNEGAALNRVAGMTLQAHTVAAVQLVNADDGSNGNTISANTVLGNEEGIVLSDNTSHALIERNHITYSAGSGIYLLHGSHNHMENNTILIAGDKAVLLVGSAHNSLVGNTITGSSDSSIVLEAESSFNTLDSNVLSDGGDAGIDIEDSQGNVLVANTVHNMSDAGIVLDTAINNSVLANDLRGNAGGITLNGSSGNLIRSNNASYNGGAGIALEGASLTNSITLNIAGHNGADGILLEAEAPPDNPLPGNLIAYNTADGNQGNGVAAARTGSTLTGNSARANGAWGIYAAEGTINGGGNIAYGNVESQQCFQFTCSNGSSPPPDTTPPETVIDSGPAATTTERLATFAFSADEAGSVFACSLDGAPFTACISPFTAGSLALGAHTFQVQATDLVGNTDPTPAAYAWTVEQPVDCGPTITLYADADAWIEQNSPSNNKGADSTLKVKAQGSNDNFRTLVRFPMPASVPAGCEVETATLRLNSSSARSGRTLLAIRLANSWSEMGVTWSNQPATVGPAAATSSGGGYRNWNVAGQVQAMLDAGVLHGFLIRDASEGGTGREQSFNSREHGQRPPMLIITLVPADD